MRRVAVMGAGNGGCAAAVDLTLRGFDVTLWSRSPSSTDAIQAHGGIEYEGVLGDGYTRLRSVTNDVAAAVSDADAVLIMAPAHAHESITRLIAPHLRRDQVFLAAPGQTLTLLPTTLLQHGHSEP